MIKLAVVIHDEKYLQKLINRLHNEKDIKLLSAVIIEDLVALIVSRAQAARQTVASTEKAAP